MDNLSIKVGAVSLDWQTETELTLDDINQLFDRIESLAQFTPPRSTPSVPHPGEASEQSGGLSDVAALHVNSIAALTSASSGPDLAIAAAASLQVAQKKPSFTRQELLIAMKEATKFYSANMSSNLTKILNGLVGSKFNQIGQNQYSLTASEFTKLEALLAQPS